MKVRCQKGVINSTEASNPQQYYIIISYYILYHIISTDEVISMICETLLLKNVENQMTNWGF